MNKNTPRHLSMQAVHHQLGGPLAYIAGPPRPLSRLGLLATSIGLVFIMAVAQLAPLLIALLPLWQLVLVFLIALMWSGTGFWLQVSSMMRRKGIETLLCTDGIVWTHRRSTEVFRWQDIQTLWREMTSTTTIRYAVQLCTAQIISFDMRVLGAKKLARILEREVVRQQFALLLQDYRQGLMLTFGPLCVSQYGLQLAQWQDVLAWHQIKYIDDRKDFLSIRCKQQQDDWAAIPLSSIPNACVLEAVIRHLHRAHRATAVSEHTFLPKRPLSIQHTSSRT